MTLNQFISRYNGKEVDTDGAYGGQCMDLMHQYIVDVLGLDLALFAAPTAYQAYKNADDPRFDKIPNSPTGVPQAGDIVFWNTTVGSAGHVAVFISGDANSFKSFDQNWPTGSFCHEQQHDYRGVAGWLHFKGSNTLQVDKETFEKLVANSTTRDAIRDKLKLADNNTIILAEIDKLIAYEDAIREKDKQLSEDQIQINALKDSANVKESELAKLQQEANELKIKVDNLATDNQIHLKEIEQLKKSSNDKPKTLLEKILYWLR